MRRELCNLLPDLAQHTVLEFLDYKLRCGKYIKRLPKDLPIYKYILKRPKVEEEYYSWHDWRDSEYLYKYDNEDGTFDICDEEGNTKYFKISLVINCFKRKYWCENTMEISYSYSDRNTYKIEVQLYDYDYDGSKGLAS